MKLLLKLVLAALACVSASASDSSCALQLDPQRAERRAERRERRQERRRVRQLLRESIAGLGSGGNPVPQLNVSDVTFDNDTLSCSDAKWQWETGTYLWTFEQIAEAFMTYGANVFYEPNTGPDQLTQCVAALVIASGECSPIVGSGCNASATGPSGVFQLDFLRTSGPSSVVDPQIEKDGDIMNLCISGYGAGYLTGAPWTDEANEKVATLESSSFYTCMDAPAYVNNYSCPDPNAVEGTVYSNYIGTFCHKGYASAFSPCDITGTGECCGIWNGGANSYQDPFPNYYIEKAEEQEDAGVDFEAICESVLDSL